MSGAGHFNGSVVQDFVEIRDNSLQGRFHTGNIAHDEQRTAKAVEEVLSALLCHLGQALGFIARTVVLPELYVGVHLVCILFVCAERSAV